MPVMNLPVLSALKGKMQWHQARQNVLSQNIANAETQGFMAKELKPLSSGALASHANAARPVSSASAVSTNTAHIPISSISGNTSFQQQEAKTYEITPEGNGVVLEEEMMKLAANQMDYQAAAMLYTRSISLLKTAIGRSA